MSVRTTEPRDGLRVLFCFTFDHRANPDEVQQFKSRLINSESILHSVEVSGTFDFICEERLPSMRAYHRRHAEFAPDVARLAARFEACFVCRRFIREEDEHVDAIWVSSRDAKHRIAVDRIDAVHAEGDYVRLQCGTESYLHDTTMNALEETLDPEAFVRLHRSMIVRLDRIASLIHQDQGWLVRLIDGTEQRIAKSRLSSVMRRVREDSSTAQDRSPISDTEVDNTPPLVDKKLMQVN
jgi:hypothetical protein